MTKRLLFVDDDVEFQKIITEFLLLEGYKVDAVNSPVEALELFKQNTYDLVITDLKMESISGLQLISLFRKILPTIKIIMITGSNSVADELNGLELGVDEYIQKPFSFEVFSKRIERVLRREYLVEKKSIITSKIDKVTINLDKREVLQNDQVIDLTKMEYNLLVLLLTNKNIVLERETIVKRLWQDTYYLVDNRSVDTHVKNLRAKMVLTALCTIRGIGYEWIE
jgi:Response regulators consisting of a CheY-like receiver domain and a winged-helix DNA-binding domain